MPAKELIRKLRVTEVSLAKWPKTKKKFDMLREMITNVSKGEEGLDSKLAEEVKRQMEQTTREESNEELTAKDLVVWLLGDFGQSLPEGVRWTLEEFLTGGSMAQEIETKEKEEEKKQAEQKEQPKELASMANDTTLKEIQQELIREREARAAQTEEMRKLQHELRSKDMREVVAKEFAHIPGKTEDLVTVLLWTQEQSPEQYEVLSGILRGCSALTDRTLSLEELGHTIEHSEEERKSGDPSTMEKAVALYMEKNPGVDRGTAVRQIAKTNPALYRDHVQQERKRRGFQAVA
jgi:hypothetical protein